LRKVENPVSMEVAVRSSKQSAMTAIRPLPAGLAYHQPVLAPVGLSVPASPARHAVQSAVLFPFRVLAAIALLPLIFAWGALGAFLLEEKPCN